MFKNLHKTKRELTAPLPVSFFANSSCLLRCEKSPLLSGRGADFVPISWLHPLRCSQPFGLNCLNCKRLEKAVRCAANRQHKQNFTFALSGNMCFCLWHFFKLIFVAPADTQPTKNNSNKCILVLSAALKLNLDETQKIFDEHFTKYVIITAR
jgi:hypothetical protein